MGQRSKWMEALEKHCDIAWALLALENLISGDPWAPRGFTGLTGLLPESEDEGAEGVVDCIKEDYDKTLHKWMEELRGSWREVEARWEEWR